MAIFRDLIKTVLIGTGAIVWLGAIATVARESKDTN